MGKQTYDPALRKTEQGSKLYSTWQRIRRLPHCDEWDYFPTFYKWALQNGYTLGSWLRLVDKAGTYSPDNCRWYIPSDKEEEIPPKWADTWNKTVNRIRKYYGMPPLEGTEYGN